MRWLISFSFLRGSLWPNQYDKGTSAADDMIVGADVAVEPSGLAGDDVCNGMVIEQAEILPGAAQPPYTGSVRCSDQT